MYKLIDYFDVWGNETDGYEVNDKIDTNIMLEIPDDITDEELINKFEDKVAGFSTLLEEMEI